MYALIALGVMSLLLCLILTPLCRDVFLKFGLVDIPDNDRKLHGRPIPRIGGLPIALSYSGALGLILIAAPHHAKIVIQHETLLISLIPAAAIVFFTGLIDDIFNLRPWQKLIGQLIGAVWAVDAGARITLLDGHPVLAFFTFPLSVLWLLGCTNAFNLIDGLDGLASGVGLFATLTTVLAAILQGNWGLAMATVPLAGCLIGFLRYNFNPASIFLGDCGSLSIGFVLGCFGAIWSQKSATFLGMLAPAMALALPLFDVLLSIGRRFLRDKPIFAPDRGHIHHRLLALGLHPRTVAFVLYAACGVAAILSLLQSSLSNHLGGLAVILFCGLSLLGIKQLDYVEFATVGRVLATGRVLDIVRHEIYLANFRENLANAHTHSDCWRAVRDACRELEFSWVRLTLEGETFEEVFDWPGKDPGWNFSRSLGKRASITLGHVMQNSSQTLMTSFLQVLQEGIQTKTYIAELSPAGKAAHALAM